MKIIKVYDGIYRNEIGNVKIFKRGWVNKQKPWVLCYVDGLNCTHQEWYKTLAEAKKAVTVK